MLSSEAFFFMEPLLKFVFRRFTWNFLLLKLTRCYLIEIFYYNLTLSRLYFVLATSFVRSVDQILWCYHSNEVSLAELFHSAIYLVCSSNFWVCGPNPMVLPFKWNLYGATFAYCSFLRIVQNESWFFCCCESFLWPPLRVEGLRVTRDPPSAEMNTVKPAPSGIHASWILTRQQSQ